MFPGIAERLEKELAKLVPKRHGISIVRVIAPPERKYSVWPVHTKDPILCNSSVPVCAARTLNANRSAWVTLSLRYERLRAGCSPRQEESGA